VAIATLPPIRAAVGPAAAAVRAAGRRGPAAVGPCGHSPLEDTVNVSRTVPAAELPALLARAVAGKTPVPAFGGTIYGVSKPK
jgi:hypothetical protein